MLGVLALGFNSSGFRACDGGLTEIPQSGGASQTKIPPLKVSETLL